MAAKISKKKTLNVTAVLSITDDKKIMLEVEDVEKPVLFADLIKEYNGQEIKISVAQSEDIA